MMPEKIFCKGCGRKINKSLFPMIYGEATHEFDDGHYCTECARNKIKKRRNSIK